MSDEDRGGCVIVSIIALIIAIAIILCCITTFLDYKIKFKQNEIMEKAAENGSPIFFNKGVE